MKQYTLEKWIYVSRQAELNYWSKYNKNISADSLALIVIGIFRKTSRSWVNNEQRKNKTLFVSIPKYLTLKFDKVRIVACSNFVIFVQTALRSRESPSLGSLIFFLFSH